MNIIKDYHEATLLIVDDDDIDAIALERALRKLKLANPIHRAVDGQAALDMLRSHQIPPPTMVLLDLNMPRMNGIEFLRALRDDPELTSTIVFVLTTSKSDEDICAAYQKHVAGYMLKQNMGSDFMGLVDLIAQYWRIVELPLLAKGQAS